MHWYLEKFSYDNNRRKKYAPTLLVKFMSVNKQVLLSLVPKPPSFLPSICIHNNTWERKTGVLIFCQSSNFMCYCECKGKIKMEGAWDQG